MFHAFLAELLTVVLAAHNQYHVHPDDTPCIQPPCHTLEYFTNNSDCTLCLIQHCSLVKENIIILKET